VVIDFSATWCGPCRAIAPAYHRLAEEFGDVVFLKLDIDELDSIADGERVTSVPKFVFKRNGQTCAEVVGADLSAIRQNITMYRGAPQQGAVGQAQVQSQQSAAPTVHSIHSDAEYESAIDSARGGLVVVDFWADWCAPCRGIAPAVERLAAERPDVLFLKVNVEECADIAEKEGITAMPTFLFFRDSIRCDDLRGANLANLKTKVQQIGALAPGVVATQYRHYQAQQQGTAALGVVGAQ
jgi:thioredoxin